MSGAGSGPDDHLVFGWGVHDGDAGKRQFQPAVWYNMGMKTKALPTREASVKKNIEWFSALSPSRKIKVLETNRKAIAYLKTLR